MIRPDLRHIADWIKDGARVLDLGCGDGELLDYLRRRRNVRGIGVDVNNAELTACLSRGLQAIHADIRDGLSLFADRSFDVVVLSQTVQSIDRPVQTVISEMLRVGRVAVVSFPNFGYWRFRLQLIRGRMPVGGELPYDWDNTPHVRFCAIADFERWLAKQRLRAGARVWLSGGKQIRRLPNLFAQMAIYQLTADGDADAAG